MGNKFIKMKYSAVVTLFLGAISYTDA